MQYICYKHMIEENLSLMARWAGSEDEKLPAQRTSLPARLNHCQAGRYHIVVIGYYKLAASYTSNHAFVISLAGIQA